MINAVVALSSFGLAASFVTNNAARQSGSVLRMSDDRSPALPFDKRPPNLDGSLPGDFGFDPAGFSNNPPKDWLIGGETSSLKWYREAEIVHGRIAQLAVVGNLFPNIWHFQGNPQFGAAVDAYAKTNPYEALSSVPFTGVWHICAAIAFIEIYRIRRIIRGDKEPGDLGLGQGGFNPFGFNYTPEEYREKQVQEIKHGRLAMFGALGMLLQARASGQGVVQQLADAFSFPDERAILVGPGALNDYFPQGL